MVPVWSRRSFLQCLGLAATATTAVGRFAMPRMVAAATPPASTLRFGVQTHPEHTSFKDILQVWQDADTLGLDTAFVFDHFIPIQGDQSGPCFEGWTLLSALAAAGPAISRTCRKVKKSRVSLAFPHRP